MPAEKPPLGAITRKRHAELRIKELARAIHEYTERGVSFGEYRPPLGWIEELAELCSAKQGAETETLEGLDPNLKIVDCDTTLEFMVLTMRALRQIYYLLYMPDGQPNMPETLLGKLCIFEDKLKKSLGDGIWG